MPSWLCRQATRPHSWRHCPVKRSGVWDPRQQNNWPRWACRRSVTSRTGRKQTWQKRFGKHGHELARHARGIDERPIVTDRERKSVSQENYLRARCRRSSCASQNRAWTIRRCRTRAQTQAHHGHHSQDQSALARLHDDHTAGYAGAGNGRSRDHLRCSLAALPARVAEPPSAPDRGRRVRAWAPTFVNSACGNSRTSGRNDCKRQYACCGNASARAPFVEPVTSNLETPGQGKR